MHSITSSGSVSSIILLLLIIIIIVITMIIISSIIISIRVHSTVQEFLVNDQSAVAVWVIRLLEIHSCFII